MARTPKPWYYAQKNAWYAQIRGEKVRLGEHTLGRKPVKGKSGWNPPRAIQDELRRILSANPSSLGEVTVSKILDRFLVWVRDNREERTLEGYQRYLNSFHEQHRELMISDLKPLHVQEWVTREVTWGSTSKRNAITAMKAALNWAARMGYIEVNPIASMEKPQANVRTDTITTDDFDLIIKANTVTEFADFITVAYDCGCRPQEVKQVEARHVDLKNKLWVLLTKESKGKQRARVVYIPTERSEEILTRLISEHPTGPLFRNSRGNAWNRYSVKCRFEAIEKITGKRFYQYQMRHTYATDKLKAGVDSHVVAQLMGHSNTAMIDRVYSHVTQDKDYMLEQAKRGAAGD